MTTIRRFATGIERLLLFITSSREKLLVIILVGIGAVVAIFYPVAIYIYPFWNNKVTYVDRDLSDPKLSMLRIRVIAPAKVIAGQPSYMLTVEATNVNTSATQHLALSAIPDQAYLSFQGVTAIPVTIVDKDIPPGMSLINRQPFDVSNSARPETHPKIIFRIESQSVRVEKVVLLPIDYVSVPLMWLITVSAPLFYALLRALKHILR